MRCCLQVYWGVAFLLSAFLSLPSKLVAEEGESQIKQDEQVVFFPSAAYRSEAQRTWVIPVHGWIYEPESDGVVRRMAVRKLQEKLGLDPQRPASALFEQRVRWFLVDNERGKSITVQIAGTDVTLKPSDRDGHFMGSLTLPDKVVQTHAEGTRLSVNAVVRKDDRRSFSGTVALVEPSGVSVISDIDDTIKVSDVRDKVRLLQRTFLEPFEVVPGMAAQYQKWASANVQFHYVSASPWQFYVPLSTFLKGERFPDGTFHLKRFRVKDSSAKNLFQDHVAYKQAVIEGLFQAYPKRKFLLVGDSGEKDPEVYGIVARRHPRQVLKIMIRDVTSQQRQDARYQSAFEGVPDETWILFQDADSLNVKF